MNRRVRLMKKRYERREAVRRLRRARERWAQEMELHRALVAALRGVR